jgi:hypothetical protein
MLELVDVFVLQIRNQKRGKICDRKLRTKKMIMKMMMDQMDVVIHLMNHRNIRVLLKADALSTVS